jgi:Ca-activated chloride channel family protein
MNNPLPITFLWPQMLWLLAAVPLVVLAYFWLLRRKKQVALRYASLGLVRGAMGAGQRFRRHVPPLLFLLALIVMIGGIARPAAVVTLPSSHETVILAMDVSGSMRAGDVEPNRITAAQNAAKAFVNDQPSSARIGIVTFAGTAALVQPPTQNREDLIAAIDRMQLQRATAIGSGILVSLKAIFPDVEFDLRGSNPRPEAQRNSRSLDKKSDKKDKDDQKPVPPGSYNAAAIILLTDGQTTTGPDPIEAARMAADRGVRVFTVGVGTPNGEVIGFEGWSMRVRLDEDTLKTIANITRGEYFYAGTAVDLKKIYQDLNTKLVFEKKETEITALFAAVATVLAVIAAMLSLMWFNRIL